MTIPKRLAKIYTASKPRDRIYQILSAHGELNTHLILDRYNCTWHDSITMKQLGRILSGDSRFEKVGTVDTRTITGKKYQIATWKVGVVVNGTA